jgi:hypothetical protein
MLPSADKVKLSAFGILKVYCLPLLKAGWNGQYHILLLCAVLRTRRSSIRRNGFGQLRRRWCCQMSCNVWNPEDNSGYGNFSITHPTARTSPKGFSLFGPLKEHLYCKVFSAIRTGWTWGEALATTAADALLGSWFSEVGKTARKLY